MHDSTPPRSDSRAVGDACSFDIDPPEPLGKVFDRLLLPSAARLRSFRFPFTTSGSVLVGPGVSIKFEGSAGLGVASSSADGVTDIDTAGEAGELRFTLFRL
jgi:hypothetical protein